uniref:NADH-ubiquinone oxidoreductase chain 4 n=1 Tax=Schistosoma spindalis TaxID=6189 RepID=Q1I0M8_SCHSI|nr:NADH dehydrogenase subunit 4 [Schistosoma spindale]AAZ57323.1 NADH dehydrogenase subunit 4 [Schistosoma spindale]
MYSSSVWFIKGFSYSILIGIIVWVFQGCFSSCIFSYNTGLVSSIFIRDNLSFVMTLLTLSIMWLMIVADIRSFALYVSIVSAIFVYFVNNVLVFWFFYELSIVSALYLLVKESYYPERYNASWYMGGYILVSSVPLLLCLLIISLVEGSLNVLFWSNCSSDLRVVYIVIILMFCTKIPIFPFHSWLPIVHAEASSPVSIILSGYIMKLGLVGIIRICSGWVYGEDTQSISVMVFLISLMYLIWAYYEVDCKRWLAILSLSHIMVSVILIVFGCFNVNFLAYNYCLGHGFSVCGMFLLLWWGYELVGSRSWLVLSSLMSVALVTQMICIFVFLGASSFPPTLQFLSEIILVWCSIIINDYPLMIVISLYLFGSSLVVLLLLGSIVIRLFSETNIIRLNGNNWIIVSIIYTIILCLLMFIFI